MSFCGSTQTKQQECFSWLNTKPTTRVFQGLTQNLHKQCVFDVAQHKPTRDSISLSTSLMPKERVEERVPISTHKPNSQKCLITKKKKFNA